METYRFVLYPRKWRKSSTGFLTGKKNEYKIFWVENIDGVRVVGIFLTKKWGDEVIEVVRCCDRILKLKSVLQRRLAAIILAYTSQLGLPGEQKDRFYDTLL